MDKPLKPTRRKIAQRANRLEAATSADGVAKYMERIPTNRDPTHPGEMLLEEFIKPMGITQKQLADSLHVPYQRINEIINQKRGITPSTALRLAKFFGMSEDFWLNLQLRRDPYWARMDEKAAINSIRPFRNRKPA